MPIKNWFKKKSAKQEEIEQLDPEQIPAPNDAASYMLRGWAYHAKGDQKAAEADFTKALGMGADAIEVNYALGLTKKAQGMNEAAIECFNKTMGLIQSGQITDTAKHEMLRRLTLGHINELTQGDWNLEDEIWRQ